ncbi:NUDIX domain-containing protein [Candidatus Woesearchaeota archaeon]|nr:NUDIX domain-containing protein [Candidatus Woesearchaeota archaeon]
MERKNLPFRINCEGYFLNNKGNIIAKESNGIVLFPGGGVDENEEIIKAMIRETKEETGVIIKDIRKLGTIKIIWGPNWAKTEKQKSRYTAFQGDEMHFFIGNIERFEEPEIKKEDFWSGNKLMNVSDVIKKIEEKASFDEDIREYREAQLKFLKRIIKDEK